MSFYIYAETAFHHEGDLNYIMELILKAKTAGFNGVKFQVLINFDEFMSSRHSGYDTLKKLVFTMNQWKQIFSYCSSLGLDIIMMPLDKLSLSLVDEFDIKFLEIHSVSFKDTLLIQELRHYDTPVIFGVGGRTPDEIDEAVTNFKNRKIILMVGFQSFPSLIEDIKIRRIETLKSKYPDCLIGYADHSAYNDPMAISSCEYAYLLGARVFEKHFTLNEGIERIDYDSAVGEDIVNEIIGRLSKLDNIFSDSPENVSRMDDKELVYRNRQKVPVASRKIDAGEKITSDMLNFKMLNLNGCIESDIDIIGKVAQNSIAYDDGFVDGDLS